MKKILLDDNTSLRVVETDHAFTAIPYYAWSHRGPGSMLVWLPRDIETVAGPPSPTIAFKSTKSCSSNGWGRQLFSLSDQLVPQASNKQWQPFFSFRLRETTAEWVQYDFEKTETISTSSIYWFLNSPDGNCSLPASWRLLYLTGGEWKEVTGASEYEVAADTFCSVTFDAVQADGLRLEVQLQPEQVAGLHEWTVE